MFYFTFSKMREGVVEESSIFIPSQKLNLYLGSYWLWWTVTSKISLTNTPIFLLLSFYAVA